MDEEGCSHFEPHAWKKDQCRHCFRSKELHRVNDDSALESGVEKTGAASPGGAANVTTSVAARREAFEKALKEKEPAELEEQYGDSERLRSSSAAASNSRNRKRRFYGMRRASTFSQGSNLSDQSQSERSSLEEEVEKEGGRSEKKVSFQLNEDPKIILLKSEETAQSNVEPPEATLSPVLKDEDQSLRDEVELLSIQSSLEDEMTRRKGQVADIDEGRRASISPTEARETCPESEGKHGGNAEGMRDISGRETPKVHNAEPTAESERSCESTADPSNKPASEPDVIIGHDEETEELLDVEDIDELEGRVGSGSVYCKEDLLDAFEESDEDEQVPDEEKPLRQYERTLDLEYFLNKYDEDEDDEFYARFEKEIQRRGSRVGKDPQAEEFDADIETGTEEEAANMVESCENIDEIAPNINEEEENAFGDVSTLPSLSPKNNRSSIQRQKPSSPARTISSDERDSPIGRPPKLPIKVYADDGSFKTLLVDTTSTAEEVCSLMWKKSPVDGVREEELGLFAMISNEDSNIFRKLEADECVGALLDAYGALFPNLPMSMKEYRRGSVMPGRSLVTKKTEVKLLYRELAPSRKISDVDSPRDGRALSSPVTNRTLIKIHMENGSYRSILLDNSMRTADVVDYVSKRSGITAEEKDTTTCLFVQLIIPQSRVIFRRLLEPEELPSEVLTSIMSTGMGTSVKLFFGRRMLHAEQELTLHSDGSDDDKYRGCHKVDVMVVVNQTPKNRATFMAQTMADFTSIMEERVGVDFASLAEGAEEAVRRLACMKRSVDTQSRKKSMMKKKKEKRRASLFRISAEETDDDEYIFDFSNPIYIELEMDDTYFGDQKGPTDILLPRSMCVDEAVPAKGFDASKHLRVEIDAAGTAENDAEDDADNQKSGNVFLNMLRAKVSKKKRRFQELGFDLDLTYITSNIVAMGFPASGREAVYRNPLEDVVRFMDTRHKDRYRLYNLCSERAYEPSLFHGYVRRFPFDDHNPPPLSMFPDFVKDAAEFLAEDQKHVVSIHCKAGKGRTAYDALNYFGYCRTMNGKGVTIPSQRRYVQYFEYLLQPLIEEHGLPPIGQFFGEVPLPSVPIRFVQKIRLNSFTRFGSGSSSIPYLTFSRRKSLAFSTADAPKLTPSRRERGLELDRIDMGVDGDVRVELHVIDYLGRDSRICHFWFHTAFIEDNYLLFKKVDIDGACKDKHHRVFDKDFAIEIFFWDNTVLRDICPAVTLPSDAKEQLDRNDPTYGIDFGLVRRALHVRGKKTKSRKGEIEKRRSSLKDKDGEKYSNVVQRKVNPKKR